MSGQKGYVRLYLDLRQPMDQLMYAVRRRDVLPEQTGWLLATFGVDVKPVETTVTHLMIEPLSDRELELLQLIATGLSNREIGLRL
jgi:LuxR family maltose regulon positive regulatory protein